MEKFNPVRPDPLKQESNPFQEKISDHASVGSLLKEQRTPVDNFNEPMFNPTTGEPAYSTGGPQFGQTDGWGKKIRGWLNKYGSSVILPIIAVLILTGGIYLYATKQTPEISPLPETSVSQEEMPAEITGITEELPAPAQENAAQKTEKTEIETIIPKAVKNEGEIIEKAVKGEGVTHLARRALKDYLQDKPREKELTKEQKIYIEDYLKDRAGSRSLNVGDEISFSEKTIQEAIDASLQLTPNQLKNLEKYSALVVNL